MAAQGPAPWLNDTVAVTSADSSPSSPLPWIEAVSVSPSLAAVKWTVEDWAKPWTLVWNAPEELLRTRETPSPSLSSEESVAIRLTATLTVSPA